MENNQTQETQVQNPAQDPAGNNTESGQAAETQKMFTQEEVNKMMEKRLARERKDLEAKIEAERTESAKLAKMSEAERQKALFDKQVKEFEDMKKAFEKEKLLNETSKELVQNNLPVEFADYLLDKDAESTFNNINTFKEKWNTALEKALDERMKGKTPAAAPIGSKSTLTMDDIKSMSATEIESRYSEVMEAMKNQ